MLRYVTTRRELLGLSSDASLPEQEIADICASFQRVVTETLVEQLFDAARYWRAERESPAAYRRTGPAARGRRRAARREIPVFVSACADRQCGDDRRWVCAASCRRHVRVIPTPMHRQAVVMRTATDYLGSRRRPGRSSSASPTKSPRSKKVACRKAGSSSPRCTSRPRYGTTENGLIHDSRSARDTGAGRFELPASSTARTMPTRI